MPEDVTSQENVSVADETDNQKESQDNLTDKQKNELRYKSIEEAEKAKDSTDAEFDKFTNFTKILTQDNANEKIETMYELNPGETNRYYKRIFGKTYDETIKDKKIEEEDNELKEENPEMYELKTKLRQLEATVANNSKSNENNLLDEFVSGTPGIEKDALEAEINKLNPSLPMNEKIDLAVSIMSSQGKITAIQQKAYKDAYAKKTASIVGMGNSIRQETETKDTEAKAMTKKFSDPSTFPPGIRKLITK